MKKQICFLLVLVLLVLTLSSCEASDPSKDFSNEYKPETDFQFALEYDDVGRALMTESPDGYYFLNNGFLYFLDKKTMEALPVCKRPLCLHDGYDTTYGNVPCDAYMGDPANIFYYDNAVYVIATKQVEGKNLPQDLLLKYSPDGTLLETVYNFPKSPQAVIRHRGVVYYTYQDTSVLGGGKIQDKFHLMSVSLKEKTEKELAVSPLEVGYFDKLLAYGKYVYTFESGFAHRSDEDNQELVISRMLVCNVETGEVSYMEVPDIREHLNFPFLCEGGLMYSFFYNDPVNESANPNDKRNCQIYKSDLDGKNPTELFEGAFTSKKLKWDGTYYYEDNLPAVSSWKLYSERQINVYNASFELVDTITFKNIDNNPQNNDFSATTTKVMTATDDYIFVMHSFGGDTACLIAVDKKQIGTGNVVPFIVWKKGR